MRWSWFASRVLGGLVAAVLLVGEPTPADACTVLAPPAHVIDPAEQGVDVTAPSAPVALEHHLYRGHPAESGGCGERTIDSCGGSGTISLTVTPGTDDRTAPELLGYRIELVEGSLTPYSEINMALAGPNLAFRFADEGDSDVDATFAVRAVDLAGNESEPVLVHVTDDVDSGSCSLGGGPSRGGFDASLWLILLAVTSTLPLRRLFLS